MSTIDVCIPTYHPDKELHSLIKALLCQEVPVRKILILNTEESLFDPKLVQGFDQGDIQVWHISQEEFDHGYARDFLARKSDADFLLYLTQDAMVVNRQLTSHLLKAFEDVEVASAFGRQLPKKDCRRSERFTRMFNYPAASYVKSAEDLKRMGIKLFFCSDVCAMYRASVYEELGGFEHHMIFNEDMVYAAAVIDAGYKIAYCADACVRHSHNYSLKQYFQRSFDMAISQKQYPDVFERAKSEKEGAGMAKTVIRQLLSGGYVWSVAEFVASCGAKFIGYRLGKNYQKLPECILNACTASPWWFQKKKDEK